MKSRVATLVYLASFSLSTNAMPHASLNQLVRQSDPNCAQSGGNNGFKDLIQQVNLFSRQNPNPKLQNNYPNDPRGILRDMAPYLGISKHESHLRQVVGDIFCPGISYSQQGTATLISADGTLLTNAHIMLGDHGQDIEALPTCFWQRKGSMEKLYIDANTFKPLTRDTTGEFFKDLAIVKLKNPPVGVRPVKVDNSDEPIKETEQYIMISATQERMPSIKETIVVNGLKVLPDPKYKTYYAIEKIPTIKGNATSIRSSDLIAQSCTAIANSRGTWGNCSGLAGTSGSPIFILKGDDILLKGIHEAGGRPKADNTPFTLDRSAPNGRSYSYEVLLNRDITDQIESLQALNEKGRTSLGEQRAGLDPK